MFEFVRTHTRLLQFLLVLLVFPSFVFFGVQGYSRFVDANARTVAVVDGLSISAQEVEAAHRQQVERMRDQMPGVDLKLFDTPAMKAQTLDTVVRERVLQAAANKDHLVVTDERLRRLFAMDPTYAALRQPDGRVNAEMLAAQGMNSEIFAERLRHDYSVQQVLGPIGVSGLPGKVALSAGVDALLEQREIQIQRFEPKDYLGKVQPSQAEIQAYYEAHTASFRTPESADIEYVVLDLDALKQQISVTDDELRAYYNENISRYTQAEERRASHILINAGKDEPAATREKAKARAQALLEEVRKNPDSFAEVARKNSQDLGSAARGGDLDFFGRGAMVKPFEDAAFAMKPGEISPLVESEFGYHIIKLTAVRGGDKRPFEAVRAEIVDEVGKQLAQKKYAEAAEQFSNLVYEQPDSLQPVIDKLKLKKQTASVMPKAAAEAKGPLASAKLLHAVFAPDAIQNKRNTEAIETAPSQLVSAHVVQHHPEQVQPLLQVQTQVVEALRQQQATALAKREGQARLTALQAQPAQDLPVALTVSRTKMEKLPRSLVDAALRADITKGAALTGVDLAEQGFAVVKVLKKVPRAADDADLGKGQTYVANAMADAEAAAFYAALKRRFKVETHPAELATAADAAASAAQ